jgi:ribosomal protein S5
LNLAAATIDGLRQLRSPQEISRLRERNVG